MPAMVIVVMGVSGSGKTTVGSLLAESLDCPFAEGDAFHPEANVDKMARGIPLTDEDRWPWLHAIAAWIDDVRGAGECGVVACSALKRSYREIIIGSRPDVRLVYLRGDATVIRERMVARKGHFMPGSLLESQVRTLEEPGADERPIVVGIEAEPRAIAEQILGVLRG